MPLQAQRVITMYVVVPHCLRRPATLGQVGSLPGMDGWMDEWMDGWVCLAGSSIVQSNAAARSTQPRLAGSFIVQPNATACSTQTRLAGSFIVQSNATARSTQASLAGSFIVPSNATAPSTQTCLAGSFVVQSNASSCCDMNYFAPPPLPQSCCRLRSHHHVEPWPLPQLCPHCARPRLLKDPLTWMEAVFRSYIPLASSCCRMNYFCAPPLAQSCCRLRSHRHLEPWPLPQLCPHCARPRLPKHPLTWMEAIFRSFIPLASSCCEMNYFCAPPLSQSCCRLRSHRHIEPWPLPQLCPHCARPRMPKDPLT